MQLTNEFEFWLGIAAFIILGLVMMIYYSINNTKEMPSDILWIDGKRFYSDEEAKEYYLIQLDRGRKGLYISIHDFETLEYTCRVKCSEYFNHVE